MKISFLKAKQKIATLWFSYSFVLFILIFIQSLTGKFETKNQEAWGWFFSTVIPNLSLMLSVFIIDIRTATTDDAEIDKFYYRLTSGLSFMYLTSILLLILLQPLTGKPIIQLMTESSVFLGPFQGLISASIGLFFVNKEKK